MQVSTRYVPVTVAAAPAAPGGNYAGLSASLLTTTSWSPNESATAFSICCTFVALQSQRMSRRSACRTQLKAKRLPRWAPEAPKRGGLASPGFDAQSMVNEVLPGNGCCYKVTWDRGIGLREGPDIHAKRIGIDLVCGEIFEAKTEVRRGGRRYFELIDGRGWAFDSVEIDGQRTELLEQAARMYTMVFPAGVHGIEWYSDYRMRFTSIRAFAPDVAPVLSEAGLRAGDVLVMIDNDPVAGLPFGQVLNRLWATRGAQPGDGNYYRVVTEGMHGMGIRVDADINSQRTGEDLIRGTVFEVDEVRPTEDGPTYLHLADGRGWVFDMAPVTPDNPSVQNLREVEGPCTLTLWRGRTDELARTLGVDQLQSNTGARKHVMTVMQDGQSTQQIMVPAGANLNSALLQEGFEVTPALQRMISCQSRNLCGTCILEVIDGAENLTAKSLNEKNAMRMNPDSYRLCCNADVYGDVTVRLRPPNPVYRPVE